MSAGPGWGGSCFPKDSASLAQVARSFGFDFTLLEHTIDLNQKHLDRTAQKVQRLVPTGSPHRKVAAWGLTFKAGTDDLVIHQLWRCLNDWKRTTTRSLLLTPQ